MDNKLYNQVLAVEGRPPQSEELNQLQKLFSEFMGRFYKANFPKVYGNFNHIELPEVSFSDKYISNLDKTEYYIEVNGNSEVDFSNKVSYIGFKDNIYRLSFTETLNIYIPIFTNTLGIQEKIYVGIKTTNISANEDFTLYNPTSNLPSSGKIGSDRICNKLWFFNFPGCHLSNDLKTLDLDTCYKGEDISFRCPFCGKKQSWSTWKSVNFICSECSGNLLHLYKTINGVEYTDNNTTYSPSYVCAVYTNGVLYSSIDNTETTKVPTFFTENIKKTFSNTSVSGLEISSFYQKNESGTIGILNINVSAGTCLIDGYLFELKEPQVFKIKCLPNTYISDELIENVRLYKKMDSGYTSFSISDWPVDSISKSSSSSYTPITTNCTIDNYNLEKHVYAASIIAKEDAVKVITNKKIKYKKHLWDLFSISVDSLDDSNKLIIGIEDDESLIYSDYIVYKYVESKNTIKLNVYDSSYNPITITSETRYEFTSNNSDVASVSSNGTVSISNEGGVIFSVKDKETNLSSEIIFSFVENTTSSKSFVESASNIFVIPSNNKAEAIYLTPLDNMFSVERTPLKLVCTLDNMRVGYTDLKLTNKDRKLILGYCKSAPSFKGISLCKNLNTNKISQYYLQYLYKEYEILQSQVDDLLRHLPVDDETAFVFQEKFENNLKIDKDLSYLTVRDTLDKSKDELMGNMDISNHEWTSLDYFSKTTTTVDEDTKTLTCSYPEESRLKSSKENHFTVQGTLTDLINIDAFKSMDKYPYVTDTITLTVPNSINTEVLSSINIQGSYSQIRKLSDGTNQAGGCSVYQSHPSYCLWCNKDFNRAFDHDKYDKVFIDGTLKNFIKAIKTNKKFSFSKYVRFHWDAIHDDKGKGKGHIGFDYDSSSLSYFTVYVGETRPDKDYVSVGSHRVLYNAVYIQNASKNDILYITYGGKSLNLYSGDYVYKNCYYGCNEFNKVFKNFYGNLKSACLYFPDNPVDSKAGYNVYNQAINVTDGSGYYKCTTNISNGMLWFRMPISMTTGANEFVLHHYKYVDDRNYTHYEQPIVYTSTSNFHSFLQSQTGIKFNADTSEFFTSDAFDESKLFKVDTLTSSYSFGLDYPVESISIPGFNGTGILECKNDSKNNYSIHFQDGVGFLPDNFHLSKSAYTLKLVPSKDCSITAYSKYNYQGVLNKASNHYIVANPSLGIATNKKYYLDHSITYNKYDSFTVEYNTDECPTYDMYSLINSDTIDSSCFNGKISVYSSGGKKDVVKKVNLGDIVNLGSNYTNITTSVQIKPMDSVTPPIVPNTLNIKFSDTESETETVVNPSIAYVSEDWYIDDANAYGATLSFSILLSTSDKIDTVFGGTSLPKLTVQYKDDFNGEWIDFPSGISSDSYYLTDYTNIKRCCIYKDTSVIKRTIKGKEKSFNKYLLIFNTEKFKNKTLDDDWNFCSNRFKFRILMNKPVYKEKKNPADQYSVLLPITVTCGCKELYS